MSEKTLDEIFIVVRDYPVNEKNGELLYNKCTVTHDETCVNEIVGNHLQNAIDTIYVFKLVAEIKISQLDFLTKTGTVQHPLNHFIK
jgi:hypothetical protein